jgi:hypothetical protein
MMRAVGVGAGRKGLMIGPLSASVGGNMRPEDAAEFQRRLISLYTLSSQVPESTRKSFERVQNLYSYGVLCYDVGDPALQPHR